MLFVTSGGLTVNVMLMFMSDPAGKTVVFHRFHSRIKSFVSKSKKNNNKWPTPESRVAVPHLQSINEWLFTMTVLLQTGTGEQLKAAKLLTKRESASDR